MVDGRDKDMIFAYLTPAHDGKWRPETVEDYLVPLKPRDEEMKAQLRHGASTVEMASTLQVKPDGIACAQRRLLLFASRVGMRHLQGSWRRKRERLWSAEEIRSLTSSREEGRALAVISSWLRRTAQNVRKKFTDIEVADTTPKGPQELAPGLREELSNERLNAIFRSLCRQSMTSK